MLSLGQSITIAEETRQLPSFNPESVVDIGTKLGLKPPISVINLIKVLRGEPSFEVSTLPNPRSSVNPAYASPFHGLDENNVYVLASDGSLWLEHSGSDGLWGHGQAPPREAVDNNVIAFQAIDANNVFVLGADRSLWFEHSVNGKFGKVPPPREPVDVSVASFQAITQANVTAWVYVLDNDGNLWLESPGTNGKFGQIPPPRAQVDSNVGAFIALPGALYSVYVLDQNGDLWLEHATGGTSPFLIFGQVPPPRELIDQNVTAFQPIDYDNVYVLGGDGKLWLEHSVNGMFGQVPPPREQVDANVVVFQGFDTKRVAVLDTNGVLYIDFADPNTGKFGQPPQRLHWSGPGINNFHGTDFQVLNPPASLTPKDWQNVPTYIVGPDGRFIIQQFPVIGDPLVVDANVAGPVSLGVVTPMYMVLTLLYAPPGPGATPAVMGSFVTYSEGSTTGVTTTTSKSFKSAVELKATVGATDLVGGPGASVDFTATGSKTDSKSIQVQKSVTNSITLSGPPQDGIDHDYDVFWIWLHPSVPVSSTPQNMMTWALAGTGGIEPFVEVQVGQLKNPPTISRTDPKGALYPQIQALQHAGLTQADFDQILLLDPFSSGSATIDTNRYTLVNQFQYEPSPTQTQTQGGNITNSEIDTTTNNAEQDYKVTTTLSYGSPKVFGIGASLSGSLTFEWDNLSSKSNSQQTTQSAQCAVFTPSADWTGPITVGYYWDSIYSSFMFAFGP